MTQYPETYPQEGHNYLVLERIYIDPQAYIERRQDWDSGRLYSIRNGGLDTDVDVEIGETQYQGLKPQ